MLLKTLDGMVSGGMFDHLAGGFHRYSVDRAWQIPHFEKMLYDNGQLASVFARAFEATGHPDYRLISSRTCRFVIDEMTAPDGGFYSSLDADSEGEEGKYYRWTAKELADARKSIDGFETFEKLFRLDQPPTFENKFYVPHTQKPLRELASQRDTDVAQLIAAMEPQREALLAVREKRTRPATDDKVLTAWNGLMIEGLSDAGRILESKEFIEAASRAAEFVENKMVDEKGRLYRSFAAGQSKLDGYVDDYAFYIAGLIALHRATNEPRWLELARKWMRKQDELFWDDKAGGYFFTSHDHPALIVRTKNPIDSAVPSGTAVTLQNLLALGQLSGDAGETQRYQERIDQTLKTLRPYFERAPAGLPRSAIVLAERIDDQKGPTSQTSK